MAQVAGLSPYYLTRLFGRYTGRGVMTYLGDVRHREAQALLRNTDLAVAEVARNYAVLRGLQLRVALLKGNIARAEDLVKLTLSRFKQGLAAEGDNLLAQRELEALNAALPLLNSAIFDAVSRIGLLLGTYSGDVSVELKKPGALPHTPERVRTGQPIELLRRRPDIRQAETELAAANAR